MNPATTGKTPTGLEIREQLARILAAESFSRSRRLSGLLDYLVTESLAGRGEKIKATTIAIEVFGRGEDFDQQGDPIVRVEAGRLRQRLADYYNGPGSGDPLQILIPKGGYRPDFRIRNLSGVAEIQGSQEVTSAGINRPARVSRFAMGIIATLVLMVGVLSYRLYIQLPDHSGTNGSRAIDSLQVKPFIAVMPVGATAQDEPSSRLAAGLVEALITNLSKVSGLSVMAHASILEIHERGNVYGITDFRNDFGVTHLLRGTVEREDNRVVLNVQLVDARTAAVIWAERMSRPLAQFIDLEEELALLIVHELAVQLQPGERERLGQYHAKSSEAWLLYRQGLVTIMPPGDPGRLQAARNLFERAMEVDPDFAGSYVGQSFSHSAHVLFIGAEQAEKELEQAIILAEKAIALDDQFAGGYAMLALAQTLGGDTAAALDNARRAVEIQPGDAFSQFVAGMSMIIANRPLEGISRLEEALRLDPLETRTPYRNLLGIAYYVSGDYSKSLRTVEYNYEIGGPRGPHMDVFLAASLARLGQVDEARHIVRSIEENYRDFPFKPWLARWIVNESDWDRTLALLDESGLNFEELQDPAP